MNERAAYCKIAARIRANENPPDGYTRIAAPRYMMFALSAKLAAESGVSELARLLAKRAASEYRRY